MSTDLLKYVRVHVWEKYATHKNVSMPCRCECGAFVRLVADHDSRCWYCPLCGAGYPYAFWAIKLDKTGDVYLQNELILVLPNDPCEECGESKSRPPCRCQRERVWQLNEEIKAIYASMNTERDGAEATREKFDRIRSLNAEIKLIPTPQSQA